MEKIIAAIDGLKFSRSTAEYSAQITRETNAHLVGIFLEDFSYHSLSVYDLVPKEGSLDDIISKTEENDKQARRQAVIDFTEICRQAKINYSIRHDQNFAIKELLHESVYADLLIIDKTESLSRFEQDVPSDFIRELLVNVECPVLVVPKEFQEIEKIILLYDGDPSSVFAIKMFCYNFSALKKLPVEVLSIKSPDKDLHIPDNRLMKEFLKRHFPDAEYTVLHGNPEFEIVEYLKNKHQNELVVLGAYRRGIVSRLFRKSMADVLMQELKTPLFIAHK